MWPFFESSPGAWRGGFLDATSFDVASDAFATLKDLFTRHKGDGLVKGFLETHYERLFGEPEDQVDDNAATAAAAAQDLLLPTPAAVAADPAAATGASGSSGVGASAGAGAGGVDARACRLVGLYGGLLGSERNFFTRRQSLKLLAELLLDRTNFAVLY
jgi:hypothetical protein